jgi:hypothetical protein
MRMVSEGEFIHAWCIIVERIHQLSWSPTRMPQQEWEGESERNILLAVRRKLPLHSEMCPRRTRGGLGIPSRSVDQNVQKT